MSKKTLGNKLAQGVRQARQPAPAAAKKITPSTPPRSAAKVRQSPASTLDSPWTNLHPERIWPD